MRRIKYIKQCYNHINIFLFNVFDISRFSDKREVKESENSPVFKSTMI